MEVSFRPNVHYRLDDTVQDKEDSIPYQLQKLFARLQLVDDAATTRDLIKSFGWDENASFEQNDVQEFCRVLFEAINTTFEGTELASLISDLYDGIYTDRLHCLNCGFDSDKEVRFNDISLTIKDDFSNVFNDSLEKALAHYLHIEKLEGDNQYECSQCNQKVDAEKGFKLIKLPKILCFNFNRFTLDYQIFQRVKINDKVTFPFLLNMNMFLKSYTDEDVKKLIDDNPLAKVRPSDLRLGKGSNLDSENDKDKEVITNETSERFNKFMESELQNLEDKGELDAKGQLELTRHQKMKEEERKHKENLKKMKKNIKKKQGGFNRKNLNSNFFTNSKKKANEVKGWAFDFGVEESCLVPPKPANRGALPGEGQKLAQEKAKQKEEIEKVEAHKADNPQEDKKEEENKGRLG